MSKPEEKSKSDLKYEEMQRQISVLIEKMEAYKPPKTTGPEHQHKEPSHFDPKDLETTCPDCKKKIDDFKEKVGIDYITSHGTEYAQKLYKDRAIHSHKCTNCQLGVSDEELKDKDRGCVLCGNKQAR